MSHLHAHEGAQRDGEVPVARQPEKQQRHHLLYIGLQPPSHGVTASITWSDSLHHTE